ncbi:kinase-like domain, phloem protein 2-like protein [Tanacetum coccineum]
MAGEVVIQLKKALEFHKDYEVWEPKLPKDYQEIILMSKCPEIYSTIKKEELYNIFSKGILLQQDKVLLSFDGEGDRNELVSAAMFTYVNSCAHKWRSLIESRFETVVEMLDISNLNIGVKADTQLLSPNVVYGVYLVFKFCNSRNFTTRAVVVKPKLYQFSGIRMKMSIFEFILESFSTYYCGEGAIFVEGIEFQAIDIIWFTGDGYMKRNKKSWRNPASLGIQTSMWFRFQEVMELLPQPVFYLKCTVKSQMLSLGTEYACYLLFKLSEENQGESGGIPDRVGYGLGVFQVLSGKRLPSWSASPTSSYSISIYLL